ncbi:MAG: hypothetical protein IKE02_05280 [Lachnospiraceae bacterium]|nr:hypothetical protein [Lachnospiraceae bacterium]
MKRIMVLILTIVMICALSACGKKTGEPEPEQEPQQEEQKETTQMANPFIDCENMGQAEEIAGFGMEAPEEIDGYADSLIQAVNGQMVQVIYFEKAADYDGDQATLFIRKKAGEDPDISGDYNEYSQTVSAGIGGHDVTLKGDDDLINVALWTADGYSYSIDTDQALTQEQMTAIIEIVE